MEKKKLFSITALFESPDEIVRAAEGVAHAGYSKFDVNTPYPVHGMDRAMKLKPTRLGFFALAFGMLGAIGMIGFISWVALADYPLVIGGKPYWSWPAFVPVTFEATVLLASVLSVLSMVVLYFKFPNNRHPLHDTPYMRAVSRDRFGISIQADDPAFREDEVRHFLESLGGREVAPVYFDPEEFAYRPRLFEGRFLLVLALTALVASGGTYVALNKVLYMPPFSWMAEQSKLKPQAPGTLFADGIGMRVPVPGTVARNFLPYPLAGKPDSAGRYLANPLLPTAEVLDRGKSKFLTYCSPCHGNFAKGDSRLRGQFPNPPTLHSEKVRTWPDGNIYHVITEGQNVMPAYASQISRDDRWAIVHYLRVLHRTLHAKESDLK